MRDTQNYVHLAAQGSRCLTWAPPPAWRVIWSSGKAFASGWTPDGVSERLMLHPRPTGGPSCHVPDKALPARRYIGR